jgi:hypothetical protein
MFARWSSSVVYPSNKVAYIPEDDADKLFKPEYTRYLRFGQYFFDLMCPQHNFKNTLYTADCIPDDLRIYIENNPRVAHDLINKLCVDPDMDHLENFAFHYLYHVCPNGRDTKENMFAYFQKENTKEINSPLEKFEQSLNNLVTLRLFSKTDDLYSIINRF